MSSENVVFHASAPGSLMLLGEYGVLQGKPALVCAVDKRVHVKLKPRYDTRIQIRTEAFGEYQTDLTEFNVERPFDFVLGAIKQQMAKMRRGCDIEITSEFPATVGLGSSAAVTVATLAALVSWLGIRVSPLDLTRQARNVIRDLQGLGSGADAAASVYGGVVYYQQQPMSVEKLDVKLPLVLYYSGFKTKTVDAVKQVQAGFINMPAVYKQICSSIGQCATEGMHFIRKKDWHNLGMVMNIQQGLMESLGVSMPIFQHMTESLRQQQDVLGAKISGSGLGDCVVALGQVDNGYEMGGNFADIQSIPVEMTLHGVRCEKS